MTSKEAIKELNTLIIDPHEPQPYNTYKAINLAISALEAFLFARNGGSWDPRALLPGETREESTYAQERISSL